MGGSLHSAGQTRGQSTAWPGDLGRLCPDEWQVEIIDENVETVPLAPTADIIGIGGMGVQMPRQRELLAYFRQRGHYVVIGGAAASLCPEVFDGLADIVIAGEAEYIWPEFCRDFLAGRPESAVPGNWNGRSGQLAATPLRPVEAGALFQCRHSIFAGMPVPL